jgi:hypothetical protein
MKLHPSVIEKLINVYTNFGGFSNERKLREQLERVDLTPYEKKTSNQGEIILVLTEDYLKNVQGTK